MRHPLRRCRPRLLAVVAVVAVVLLMAAATAQPSARSSAQDAALLEALALRLAAPMGEPGVTFELLPGALPADLPLDAPMPHGGRLLGALARRADDGRLLGAQIVLESPLGTGQSFTEVRMALEEQGFRMAPQPNPTGFLPHEPLLGAPFCREGGAVAFANTMSVRSPETGRRVSDIRIDVQLEPGWDPCPAEPMYFEAHHLADGPPLPALLAPEGAETFLHGGAIMPDQASSSALFASDLGPAALRAHFEAQLAAQGWRSAGGEEGASHWTLADPGDAAGSAEGEANGDWSGTLLLLPVGGRVYASFVMVPLAPTGP